MSSFSVIKTTVLAVTVFAFSVSTSAYGETLENLEPGFYPELAVAYEHDSNIFRSKTGEVADNVAYVSPSALYRAVLGKHSLDVSFFGDFSSYQDNSDENYTDYFADADLLLDLTRQLNINVKGAYINSHDPRGASGTRAVASTEPDLWNEAQGFAEILYGRRTSKVQVSASFEGIRRLYTNNAQETRSRDVALVTADFFYNVGLKTSLLAEISQAKIDYTKPARIKLDSVETRYMLGVKWKATAKTTGEVKVGYLQKKMDDPSLDEFSGVSASAKVLWEPRTYSWLVLSVARETQETPYFYASYYLANQVKLDWRHEFTKRVGLNSGFIWERDEYSGAQSDDLLEVGVGLTYSLLKWLEVEARYSYDSRNSDNSTFDYQDNIFTLTLTAARKYRRSL